jgi:hypothetical protein
VFAAWQKLASLVYHLLVAPGPYPRRKHLKGPPIGLALALPSNPKARLERVTKGKHSSLLGIFISDEGKKVSAEVLIKTIKMYLPRCFLGNLLPKIS